MENKLVHIGDGPRKIPYQLIKQITNDFDKKLILGSGGFGTVYKGVYENGDVIAVKILHSISGFDCDEFQKEFQNLRGLKHPNIVELVGFCDESNEVVAEYEGKQVTAIQMHTALCFEYVYNGSLQKHISDEQTGLNWDKRYKIIKGICEGLKYLRDGMDSPVMHFDLKPDNILLDKSMQPKIADFGLSRLLGEHNTTKTMNFVGTCGYWPPEYIKHQVISKEFDIFSLGVIIVKIVTGHEGYKSMADMSNGKFVKFVHGKWREVLRERLSDPRSLEVYCNQVKRCVEIALECLKPNRQERPTIQYIISILNETETMLCDKGPQIEQFYDNEKSISHSKSSITSMPSTEAHGEASSSTYTENRPAQVLPFSLLKEITDCFSAQRLINSTEVAKVYMGVSKDGQVIALNVFDAEVRSVPDHDFEAVVERIMRVQHKNVIRFVGYCNEITNEIHEYNGKLVSYPLNYRIMCFEYSANQTLYSHTSGISSGLDWHTRYKIIKGICEGLRYIHEDLEGRDEHLNLDTSKIWLDDHMMPKIGNCIYSMKNFGDYFIGRPGGQIRMPPEFTSKQVISEKYDIYSLGIIVIEIMAGRKKCRKSQEMLSHKFSDLVHAKWRKRLGKIVKPTLVEGYCEQVKECIRIAFMCLEHERLRRPAIGEIIHMLNETEKKLAVELLYSDLLQVHPIELCFPFEPKKAVSCSLHLNNKGDNRVAFLLVPNSIKRYITKLPLGGVVPPRCTYTLTVTMRKQPQPTSESGQFFTLQSVPVGEYVLDDVNKDLVASDYENFFKKAKETMADEVQEVTLTVTCGLPAHEVIQSTVEAITTKNAQQVLHIEVHPTEPWIMTTHQGGNLHVWNYRTMATLNSFEVTEEPVREAKFITRQNWILAGDCNGGIHVYNYNEHEEASSFDAHDSCITSLAVHPTHPFVLSSSHDDHLIKLWDWDNDWQCTRTFQGHFDRVMQVTFSTDDTDIFASASCDGTVKIWSVSCDDHNIITLGGHADSLLCVDFFTRYNRRHLITGSEDRTAQIWDLEKGGCLEKLEGHAKGISAVILHPELPVLITGSFDGTLRIWNSTTYKLESIISLNFGAVFAFGCIKGSRRIVVGCQQGLAVMEIPCFEDPASPRFPGSGTPFPTLFGGGFSTPDAANSVSAGGNMGAGTGSACNTAPPSSHDKIQLLNRVVERSLSW